MISRRHFAKLLGASACLLPFLGQGRALAAAPAKRRLIVVWSLTTNHNFWRPPSPPGQPVTFANSLQALAGSAGDIVLVDGLSPGNTGETHGTPQALTGLGFGDHGHLSVDQFIAQRLGLPSPLLLGVNSASEGQFHNAARSNGAFGRLSPNDDPQNAFSQLFGGQQVPNSAVGASFPRKRILDMVAAEVRALQATLGSEQKLKLDQHLEAIDVLEGNIKPPKSVAGCAAPSFPDLGGLSPQDGGASIAVGEAHRDLIVAALACGLTQVVGMQWGTSATEYLGGQVNIEEHSAVHSTGPQAEANLIAAESYLANWYVGLINRLRATADPFIPNKSLLDTTMVVWTRDFGGQTPYSHMNSSMGYVLAGATDYLKTNAQGTYLNYGGDNNSGQIGQRHERLLVNLCEMMGVGDTSGFGSLGDGERTPLTELKV